MINNKKVNFFICFIAFFCVFAQSAFAQTADIDIVAKIVLEFNKQADSWYKIFQDVALNLFYVIAVIEIAYIGIRSSISVDDFKETFQKLVIFALTGGFFMAVIHNYQEWSQQIIRGLQAVAGQTGYGKISSDSPMMTGLYIFDLIKAKVEGLSWDEFGATIIFLAAGFIILISFIFITANVILVKCESIIATLAAFILIGFGASAFLREYAINTLRYVLSVAFKLFTMQLVIGVGSNFITQLVDYDMTIDNSIVIIAFSLILLLLSQKVPEIVAGIISGSHTGSGGFSFGMAKAGASFIGGAIGGGIGGAIGAGKGAQAISNASKIAQAEGSGGALGTLKALNTARQQVNMKQTNIGNELKSRMSTINEIKK